MKKIFFSYATAVVLLSVIFQLLAVPARAEGPTPNSDTWTGKVWLGNKFHERTFYAPEGAVEAEVLVEWRWEGHPTQNQRNEKYKAEINGQHTIHCDDYGNEEYDGNNDGIGDYAILCGAVKLEGADDLHIEVEFTGDNSTAGSHLFEVTVTWKTELLVTGSVSAAKVDELGQPWEGIMVKLYQADGSLVGSSLTPAHFTGLALGNYYIEEEVPAGSEPISPTRFDFSLTEQHLHIDIQFQNRRLASCDTLQVALQTGQAPLKVTAKIGHTRGTSFKIDWGNGDYALNMPTPSAEYIYTSPGDYDIVAQVQNSSGEWITSPACTAQIKVTQEPSGSVSAAKIDELGQPWEGIMVKLYQADGSLVGSGLTPAYFTGLALGSYYIEEEVPAGSEPISLTRFDFSLTEQHLHIDIQFQNRRPYAPVCNVLRVTPKEGSAPLTVTAVSADGQFDKINWGDGDQDILDEGLSAGKSQANHIYTKPGRYHIMAWVIADDISTLACAEVIVEKRSIPTTGQYQDFTGPVAFGTFTPYLEPGKEYFDMTRSIMYNVEYVNANQGEIVYRFNGQEIDQVTSSLFRAGSFRQVESANGRAVMALDEGVTKLIAYRYGVEQARIFQTLLASGNRWVRPLDQPFEHKYQFELELHGPQAATDLLVYGDKVREIRYDENGLANVGLTYAEPGLAAIYPLDEAKAISWVTVASLTYPITTSQVVNYNFEEIGLYHYRVVDGEGRIVSSGSSAQATFEAQPGQAYQAQLVYPATSLFVGLYDDMKFKHPDTWLMPIDGRLEHAFEFHLDYHRLNDPDLGNDHIRGEVVVDALYLTNGTTSVAQQFPYGRHDGALPGVTIVGIPTVSMVAFCQRPGYHEVAYWGGWENESYYLPERSWIFDQNLAEEWTEDQRGDCIDTARRVNMLLARAGLRTDHTYRHHGEQSQGYQMTQLKIWSPYNLVGMRPPHLGQILKPGISLPYYENSEDMLFWGWDLVKGGLADGIGEAELKQHVASLGPVIYGDQTGIHPAEALN